MDEIARYNIKRWKALAGANALFTRPFFHLTAAEAAKQLDPEGRLGELTGKHVLCLAGGGGKQSAMFALLGAQVTVLDLSQEQLQRDREVARHYSLSIETVQGDMRDLSCLPEAAFDIVWHPYSINFIPDVQVVFRQVARILRRDGLYYLHCTNPFGSGMTEQDWNGEGYVLRRPYLQGAEITYADQAWVYKRGESTDPVPEPREYQHTLSTLMNRLIEQGFVIQHVSDSTDLHPDPSAEPGTWDHFVAYVPPWLAIWARYRPADGVE
ncbi:MAG TPA: class I SAM-dependent methyltransferase [Ktedonobacteraceae bacterium]